MSGKKRTSSAVVHALGGQLRDSTPHSINNRARTSKTPSQRFRPIKWHFRRACALREDNGPLEEAIQHFEACVHGSKELDAACNGHKRSSAASSSSGGRGSSNKRRRKAAQSKGLNSVTVFPPSSSFDAVRDIDTNRAYLLACAYTELGKIHEREGRVKEAMECYQSASETSADAWLAMEAYVLMGIITRTVAGTGYENYFRAAISAIELHDDSNGSDDHGDESEEDEEAQALQDLYALARFHLGLHLCQGSCTAEGDILLSSLGFRWRLSDDILAYPPAPSPSSSAPSSAGAAALPTNPASASAYASHVTSSSPPYVNVLDGVLSAELLEELKEVFKPDSVFWSEHAYERADTGYFSYMFDLQQQPQNAVEEAVQRIHQDVAKWRPAAAKARWGEWWAHTRRHGAWHPLHFDTDEGSLRAGQGVKTPSVSTVLYTSGEVGGPTVVMNQPVEGPGVTEDVDGVLVYPKANRLAMFDGRMLHGVVPSHGASSDSSARRVTFMVGFWEDAKPRGVDGGTEAGAGPMRLLPEVRDGVTWPSRLGRTGGWRRTVEPQPAPVITVQSAWSALSVTRTPHTQSSSPAAAAASPPTISHLVAEDGAEKGHGRRTNGSHRVRDGDDHLDCASDACSSDSGDSDEEEDEGSVCASEPPLPVQITGRFVLARGREVEEEIERVDRAAIGVTRAIHALVGGSSGDKSSRSTRKGSSGGGGGGVCRAKALKILRDWLYSHTLDGHDREDPSFQDGIAALNRNSAKIVRALCQGLGAGGHGGCGAADADHRSRGRDGGGRAGGGNVGWEEAEACIGLQVINLLPGLDKGMTWLMTGGLVPILIAQVGIPLVHSTTTTTHPSNAATTTRRHSEALKTLCKLTGEDEACAFAAVEAGAIDGMLTYMENVGAGGREAAAAVLWNVLRARERGRQGIDKTGEEDGESGAESVCMAETRQRLIGWLQEEEDDDSRRVLCGAIAWAGEATLGDIRAIRATGVIEVLAEDGGQEELEALARLSKGQGRKKVEQAVCKGVTGGKAVWSGSKAVRMSCDRQGATQSCTSC